MCTGASFATWLGSLFGGAGAGGAAGSAAAGGASAGAAAGSAAGSAAASGAAASGAAAGGAAAGTTAGAAAGTSLTTKLTTAALLAGAAAPFILKPKMPSAGGAPPTANPSLDASRARLAARMKAQGSKGLASTNLTGGRAPSPTAGQKQLLGQ